LGAAGDPDDFIRKHGTDAFKVLLERSETHIEYRLLTIKNKSDMSTDEGRLSYLAAATELLSELKSKPEREVYGARVASTAGVSPDAVQNEIIKKIKIRKARQKKEFEKGVVRPTAKIQPASRELRYTNETSAVAEEGVIRCLVRDPTLIRTTMEMGFSKEEFTSAFLAGIYDAIAKRVSEGREAREALLLSEMEPDEASQLTVVLQKPESLPHCEMTIREYIEKIRAIRFKTGNPDGDMLLEIKRYRENKDIGGIEDEQ
jgi:DNA primase